MERQNENAPTCDRRVPHDWARLIRKLRWIGMDDEAERLAFAVSTLSPEQRAGVSAGPFNTD